MKYLLLYLEETYGLFYHEEAPFFRQENNPFYAGEDILTALERNKKRAARPKNVLKIVSWRGKPDTIRIRLPFYKSFALRHLNGQL